MSDPAPAPTDAVPKKKKGKKALLIYALGGIVLIGGGLGAGVFAASSGMLGGGHAGKAEPDLPKLVPRAEGHDGEGHGPGAKYEATYVPIEQAFTANLRDSDSVVQMSLAVATYYDSRVADAIKKHETPIRSAVIETLGDQDPLAVTTPAGKKGLQLALTRAINATLRQKEGFGGVDNVYFTSFIVQ